MANFHCRNKEEILTLIKNIKVGLIAKLGGIGRQLYRNWLLAENKVIKPTLLAFTL